MYGTVTFAHLIRPDKGHVVITLRIDVGLWERFSHASVLRLHNASAAFDVLMFDLPSPGAPDVMTFVVVPKGPEVHELAVGDKLVVE